MNREAIRENVDRIRRELAEASGGRYPVPRLMAVTKTRPPEEILLLKDLGITEIGENRVQELKAKLPELGGAFRVHLIGRLQRNKVRQIIGDVCMIQSVDSEALAEEISRRAADAGRRNSRGGNRDLSPADCPAGRDPGERPDGCDAPDGRYRIPGRPVCRNEEAV